MPTLYRTRPLDAFPYHFLLTFDRLYKICQGSREPSFTFTHDRWHFKERDARAEAITFRTLLRSVVAENDPRATLFDEWSFRTRLITVPETGHTLHTICRRSVKNLLAL